MRTAANPWLCYGGICVVVDIAGGTLENIFHVRLRTFVVEVFFGIGR